MTTTTAAAGTPLEWIDFAWDEALARNDGDALLALYAEDAVLESPLFAEPKERKRLASRLDIAVELWHHRPYEGPASVPRSLPLR